MKKLIKLPELSNLYNDGHSFSNSVAFRINENDSSIHKTSPIYLNEDRAILMRYHQNISANHVKIDKDNNWYEEEIVISFTELSIVFNYSPLLIALSPKEIIELGFDNFIEVPELVNLERRDDVRSKAIYSLIIRDKHPNHIEPLYINSDRILTARYKEDIIIHNSESNKEIPFKSSFTELNITRNCKPILINLSMDDFMRGTKVNYENQNHEIVLSSDGNYHEEPVVENNNPVISNNDQRSDLKITKHYFEGVKLRDFTEIPEDDQIESSKVTLLKILDFFEIKNKKITIIERYEDLCSRKNNERLHEFLKELKLSLLPGFDNWRQCLSKSDREEFTLPDKIIDLIIACRGLNFKYAEIWNKVQEIIKGDISYFDKNCTMLNTNIFVKSGMVFVSQKVFDKRWLKALKEEYGKIFIQEIKSHFKHTKFRFNDKSIRSFRYIGFKKEYNNLNPLISKCNYKGCDFI